MKIILPSFLHLEQQVKLKKQKYARQLQADPIQMEIDGKILRFRHVDFKDMPNTHKNITKAISQFKTDEDFHNLRPLLEGLHHAGRKFPIEFFARIIRLVCMQGRVYDMIEAARRVSLTGLKLDTSEKINELLHWIQMKAIDSEWNKTETAQALKWTQLVMDMLEDEKHQPTVGVKCKVKWMDEQLPFSRDAQVLLAELHLAAAMVVKCGAGEETRDRVNKLAKEITRLWPQGKGLKDIHPEQAYKTENNMGYLLSRPNKFVALATPLLHGLQLASEVVKDPELWRQLNAKKDIVNEEVQQARQEARESGKNGRGEFVYKKLYDE